MKWRVFSIALSAVLLGGCSIHSSQAPVASTYPLTKQQKMQAAHHWDVLANHQAELLSKNEFIRLQPLHILGGDGKKAPFNAAFDSLLTSQLVNRGLTLKTTSRDTINISYDVQVIHHKDRGLMRAPQGAWTILATGIAVATIPFNNWAEPSLALIPAAAAVDLFSGEWVSRSNQEVVITTKATDGDRIVFSSSSIYYINAGDNDHYEKSGEINLTDNW